MRNSISKIKDGIINVLEILGIVAIFVGIVGGIAYLCYTGEKEHKEKTEYYIDACSKGDQTACRVLREASIHLN